MVISKGEPSPNSHSHEAMAPIEGGADVFINKAESVKQVLANVNAAKGLSNTLTAETDVSLHALEEVEIRLMV